MSKPAAVTAPPPIRRKADRSRDCLLIAAARLFRTEGYHAATMRRIAAQAGMEAGSVYYHFRSKTEILDAVLDRGVRELFDETRAWVEANPDAPFREAFTQLVDLHMRFLHAHRDFTAANILLFPVLNDRLRARHRPLRKAYAGLWDDVLQHYRNVGALRSDIAIQPLRRFTLGALNWTVEWFDADRFDVAMLSSRVARLLLDGMSAPASRGRPVLAPLPSAPMAPDTQKSAASGKADRSRLAILRAAAHLFRVHGIKATTMRAIANAAGIEAGSIYYHFDSKEEILDAVLDLGLRDLLDGVRAAIACPAPSGRDRIAAAMATHLHYLFQASDFTLANIHVYGQLPRQLRARHASDRHEYARLWDGLLRDAREAGEIRADIKVKPLRQLILGALNWTVEWFDPSRADQPGHHSLDELTRMLQLLLLDGLTAKA